MLTEDYCNFDIAKLLEEKGFNLDECEVHYDPYNHQEYEITLQMAMKWLREVHKIAINIGWGEVFEENYQWWCIILNQNSGEILRESEYYKTYEEAAEAAIKYCLENLI